MTVVLALLSALSYGVSDFLAGVTSRAWDSRLVTAVTQSVGLLTALVAVLLVPGAGPAAHPLAWGAVSGAGSALGVLMLYRGFAVASMSVVAPLCGVVTCVIPPTVGIALGDTITVVQTVGIVLAVPAVWLVSRERRTSSTAGAWTGVLYGLTAGVGFGLLFVGLDTAGTASGAWPLLANQLTALTLITPFVVLGLRSSAWTARGTVATTVFAGLLSGAATIFFLLATRHGELAIVGVLSSLYPAGTVLMARLRLAEEWSRTQVVGLLGAAAAVVLVAVG